MQSIIQDDSTYCFLDGKNGHGDPLEKHHVFFGVSNRQHSEEDGLTVWLCGDNCHRNGKKSAHRCNETNRYLKRKAQTAWELKRQQSGMTPEEARKAFIARYGKSEL